MEQKIFIVPKFRDPFYKDPVTIKGGFAIPKRKKHRCKVSNLNMLQLLNPIFYSKNRRHPDSKRQRKDKLEALTRQRCRMLKNIDAQSIELPALEFKPYSRYRSLWDAY